MTLPPGPLARTIAVLLCGGAFGLLSAATAHASAALTDAAGDPVTIRLAATLQPGSLVISVPAAEVTLPSPTLSHGGTLLTAVGRLQPIAVTDNRSGNPGWTLSGVITGASPGQTGFDGQDLGWNPSVVGYSPGQRITLGLAVEPGSAAGLAQPQVLAYTTGGVGLGTARLSAALTLDLPTAAAGLYSVTLTLTAI
ncbi:MAG TPA: hypothetical protein VGX23_28730 [Actinocrinis sp.]|nr:hypothetical protein [Actinocrinis sp.]